MRNPVIKGYLVSIKIPLELNHYIYFHCCHNDLFIIRFELNLIYITNNKLSSNKT